MKYALIILTLFISNFTSAQSSQYAEVVNYYNAEKNFNGALVVATNGHIDYINGIFAVAGITLPPLASRKPTLSRCCASGQQP